MKVEVIGGPFDGDILEVDEARARTGICMLDTTKMRMNPFTGVAEETPIPSVHMDIKRNSNGKYYVFWPKEN